MKIGQHELRGSKAKLEKPLAVLKKVVPNNGGVEMMDISDGSASSGSGTEYTVVGVVRQKFLFKDRPKVLLETQPDY